MELLLLLGLTSVNSLPLPNTACNRMQIDDHFYDQELLWANLGKPYNLNIHKTTNNLFFSYSLPETYSDTDFQLAVYNIDTKQYYDKIAGLRGGCTTAIDNANDEVYMAGSEGIYKYNVLTRLADFYKEKGVNIWSLFYRTNLFYIGYPEQKLHMEIDGTFAIVKEFANFEIDLFYVTSNGEIYFANKTGLYKYDNQNSTVEVINELITVRQITEDQEDNVYFCTNFGIYKNVKFEGLKKVLGLKNIFGLAFDKDNHFIISDEKSIIKLNPSEKSCIKEEPHW